MIVMKFGGTSVSSKQNIEQLKSVLLKKKENYIVVVSAFSTITNKLEEIARLALADNSAALQEEFKSIHFKLIEALFPLANQTELFMLVQQKCNEIENICASIYTLNELSFKTQAHIVSYGEQMSSFILYKYLNQEGIEIECLDSRELIIANNSYLNADVDFELTEKNISQKIEAKNYIAGGFIASNPKQETVTLGRGGSDYSAAIFASAIEADFLEIWSDVNGIHSANPNIVKNTISIKELSYEEAFELAYFGAKVLYPPTILPIMNKNIPLHLKNMLYPEQEGTYIGNSDKEREHKIQGVSSLSNVIILTVSGVGLARKQGSARRVFQALEEQNINIILITQSCSEQSIGIGIKKDHLEDAKDAIHQMFSHEISNGLINKVSVTEEQSIIALVGDNMKNKVGLSGKIFGAIGENGINITAIAQGASERNISIVVHQDDEEKAIHVIHEKFFNNVVKNVHLFIAGVGNVGDEFLNILEAQKEKLIKEHQINLKIIGVANSSKMLFGKDELDNAQIRSLKEDGVAYDSFGDFLSRISDLNLRNSIFIDNTASDIVSKGYSHLLE
ncbi:MAG: aspartate kinase, partial [Crocinitomicaceae bacterium]|nr:aspartate kinase [Crocinitomicaceae bacterium]